MESQRSAVNFYYLQLKYFRRLAKALQTRLTLPSFYQGLLRISASDARFELFQLWRGQRDGSFYGTAEVLHIASFQCAMKPWVLEISEIGRMKSAGNPLVTISRIDHYLKNKLRFQNYEVAELT